MGVNPTEVADVLPISVQSVRKLFGQFRDDLSYRHTEFYFAAFELLDAHWPGNPSGGTMGRLKLLSTINSLKQDDVLRIYECIMKCPVSLPPKRLKRAMEIEATIPRPSLVDPNPKADGEQPEFHDRRKCTNCVFPGQRGQVASQFLDAVTVLLSYYRNIPRTEFGEYFFGAALSAMLNQYFVVVQNELIDQGVEGDDLRQQANSRYEHVAEAISKLAFEVLSGRELRWHDMDPDGSSGLEGLF